MKNSFFKLLTITIVTYVEMYFLAQTYAILNVLKKFTNLVLNQHYTETRDVVRSTRILSFFF